jgi:ubiquinone/menaquinone biosynthesis C-methylase UbiE
MFTSYGYLPSLKDDLKSLKEVTRILKKDGVFMIDIANREHLLRVFRKKDWGEFPNFFMLEKRCLDANGSKLHSKWIIIDKESGREKEFSHNLRLYTFKELKKILRKARLMVDSVYGDYDKRKKFSKGSPRLILVIKKKGL